MMNSFSNLLSKDSINERYKFWRFLIHYCKPSQIELINRAFGSALFWEGPIEAHAICNCAPKKEKIQ